MSFDFSNQQYKDINRTIYWPGGGTKPPANGPDCGWSSEFCPEGLTSKCHYSPAVRIPGLWGPAIVILLPCGVPCHKTHKTQYPYKSAVIRLYGSMC